ncbi:MAG: amino acid permease [Halodesulfurarchaeum sp.]
MSEESAEYGAELNRDIGLVGAIAIGVGTMIAAGIFVLSGLAVSNVGAMAIVSFLIAAVVASFTAFAYAEFSAIYPESGGGYAYVANVFDTDLTYIVGWSMILGYPASAAFYLASFSDWFYRFIVPALDIPEAIPYWVWGLVILVLLVGVNLKGTKETGMFQIGITALKVALIILFLAGGLQAFDPSVIAGSFGEYLTDFRDIGLTSALVFITFFGFEAIATNAEEIESPGRNVPRAIFFSMGFVTIIYTLVVLVVVIAINDPEFLEFLRAEAALHGLAPERFIAENGEIAMGRAAQYYLGPVGFYVIIVGALFSMLSAANATILAGSRVKLAMSRRDHLPSRFEELHPTFETPHRAVLLTGTYILVFIGLFTVVFGGGPGSEAAVHVPGTAFELHLGIEAIAHFADFMLLFGLIVVNLAVIQSRRKHPDLDRPFTVPGVPYVPIIAVLANLVLLVNVEPSSFLLGVIAELIGVGLWFGVISGPEPEALERETPTVVEESHPGDEEYELLVPIANPDHVPQLMRTAMDIAEQEEGGILVMNIVTLPEQTPLSRGYQYVDERREILESAREFAEDREVPVSGTIRIAHHPGDAILNTIEQEDADAVLMGWSGSGSRRRDIVLGSTVDEVVREAKCDVLVESIGGKPDGDLSSILVPTAGGPHAEFAADVTAAIARSESATVTLVHVVGPDAGASRRQEAAELLQETRRGFGDLDVETEVLSGQDVVETVVEETGAHDLVVLGATREGLLQELLFGAIPEGIATRSRTTVIMAKRHLGITSRLRRWLRWE